MKIGVIAMQGAFREHEQTLARLGVETLRIRRPEQLSQIDGIIIPGGESTTIGKLLGDFNLMEPLRERILSGLPVFGTCAGMILLAKEIENSNQPRIGTMDIKVARNAFGRQVDSFEVDLEIPEVGQEPVRAVFIRAPYILEVKPSVQVLAKVDDKIVMARQDNMLVSAFHPELTDDLRIHRYFIEKVCKGL
ncbi:pyridoxal 5'-phosphate synthase glutaminase subunit PdxT [Carboxydothermus hydrogenoformans]|uniref:Pyridoxal 5'-phosphate synthase subunit PdxT n=1 Tax=Carboxydothermus hydrogenoformans (strain ATCC BAA-161 / DSM 6008 / Z-2901) TaxID=246194 RepID=PDXT_CARHZ|nr:pyridoxal 5'-phosphate synthase glutaminase subunit PdxT [Carboxydothermus hydrogenoformans]Q3A8Q0.1 RecName: Full=Pyridoxal 5'-phosphate synthase subunit PdxT; AltName: Full=Pdx2; AltName: Full=Pyridoxal 5'-phosphate synthase glutaminase subunit [Carboxydothermus hydrogenoformans Z-2901]ABB13687.1 glutamine amidotransferase, SNO family [Carboxydothermus hydrogenoformans Z-2901]